VDAASCKITLGVKFGRDPTMRLDEDRENAAPSEWGVRERQFEAPEAHQGLST
jgi:hypothetical protein